MFGATGFLGRYVVNRLGKKIALCSYFNVEEAVVSYSNSINNNNNQFINIKLYTR